MTSEREAPQEYAIIMPISDDAYHEMIQYQTSGSWKQYVRGCWLQRLAADEGRPAGSEIAVEIIQSSITEFTDPKTGEVVQLPRWCFRASGMAYRA